MTVKKALPLHSLSLLICKRRLNQATGLTWYYYFFQRSKSLYLALPHLGPILQVGKRRLWSHTAIGALCSYELQVPASPPFPLAPLGPRVHGHRLRGLTPHSRLTLSLGSSTALPPAGPGRADPRSAAVRLAGQDQPPRSRSARSAPAVAGLLACD